MLRPLSWIALGLLALFAILLVLTFLLETGGWTWSENATVTGEKIVETVMLALMATTLGITVGVPLSFFSARNLMRNIRSPMIGVGLFLVGIPVGILAGTMWGRFATDKVFTIGSDGIEVGLGGESMFLDHPINAVVGLAVMLALGWLLLRWLIAAGDDPDPTTADKVQRGFGWLGFVLLLLESVLVSGYLLMWFGEYLQEWMAGLPVLKSFDFLAGFLAKLGDVFTTFFTAMTAILAALAGALGFSRLGHALNDHLPRPITSLLRYPAGFAGIAVISIGIGGMVNYLYRYDWNNPAIPATAGALMLAVAGGILLARVARPLRDAMTDTLASILLFLIGITGILVGGTVGILFGWSMNEFAGLFSDAPSMWAAGLVGGILGSTLAFTTRRLDALPAGMITYYLSRSLFNGIRSVEPLVMAIVFVVWVGLGPFAGSLALALHTVAALAKLYSEQVESTLPGPIEAVTATGATRLQNVVYAVVPQIVPPYIAFTLYRWDINVRMSTIIGFVGGGGIGFLLQQNINLLDYRAASVQMLAIAVVVALMDYVSSVVREKMV